MRTGLSLDDLLSTHFVGLDVSSELPIPLLAFPVHFCAVSGKYAAVDDHRRCANRTKRGSNVLRDQLVADPLRITIIETDRLCW